MSTLPPPPPLVPVLADLLTLKTEADWVSFLTTALETEGWSLTDAYSGAVGRTLMQVDARSLADVSLMIPLIAASGFVDLAAGGWLDLIAYSQYNLLRQQTVATEGFVTFTAAAGFGAYQLPVPTWIATPNRLLYQTLAAVTVPQGGTVQARVRAEQAGAIYNVGPNQLTSMLTPLPGLTVTNAADWVAIAGADAESDARLVQRCKAQWATLGTGATRDAYVAWALDASPSVTQVQVLDMDPRGPGTVDVVLAGDGGAVGSDVVATVDSDLQAKRPLTCNLLTYSATPTTVAIAGTVYVQSAHLATAQAQVQMNLDLLQLATEIGATVYVAALIEQIMLPVGVINVTLTSPASDVALADVDVAVFDTSGLVYQAV